MLVHYDDVVINYKNGTTERHTINISENGGVEKRNKLIKFARKSKKVSTFEWVINSKIEKESIK